jgi:hypothetical protein
MRKNDDSIIQLELQYNKYLLSKAENTKHSKSTIIATTKHWCKTTSISDLNPFLLKDLLIPHVHLGKYFLWRTITYSFFIVGVITFVEDLNGDVEQLGLYHFQKSLIFDPNTSLPSGNIFILKEPYLKYASQ